MGPSPIRDSDFPDPLCERKYLDMNIKYLSDKTIVVLTFFVQNIVGTGFPEALHSSVTAPPLRAVI
jgi:hypothetical protein